MGRRYIDYKGKYINGIYVIDKVKEKGGAGKHVRWECECPICHKVFTVKSDHLGDKKNPTRMCHDCGSKQYTDLSGEKYGMLTVLERDWNNPNKRISYICECECGSIVSVQENHLKDGRTRSCGCIMSVGEKEISNILSSHDIIYEKQKQFMGCKNLRELRFDFYIPSTNTVIEYNGIQHYKPVEYFGGTEAYLGTCMRDNIKKEYCLNNNINYIEISYKDNILQTLQEKVLNEEIVSPHGNMME